MVSIGTKNRLITGLPARQSERLLRMIEPVALSRGETLYRHYEPIHYLYFPEDSVLARLVHMSDGATVETEMIGYEGMAGLPAHLTANDPPVETVVRLPGGALRAEADSFLEEVARNRELKSMLHRYAMARIVELTQTAACNCLHSVEQRLCRWLLMMDDRSDGAMLPVTHEALAGVLGAGRTTVSLRVGALKKEGLVAYTHGALRIIHRTGLERHTCECYGVIRRALMHTHN
jgi:CRP-like cAMP-binding protein